MHSKEIKIAITAILAIVIIYVGIIFLKGLKLFSTDNIYYVEMSNVGGLTKSSEVTANGMNIGLVKEITYDGQTQMLTLAIELNEGFSLPRGSYANITKEMLGSPKLNVVLGRDPAQLLAIGDTIKGDAGSGDLMAAAGNMLPQVEQMLPKLDSILSALNALTNDPSLLASLHNVEMLTNDLQTTTAEVNALLGRDVPQLMGHANTICANLETTTAQLNQVDVAGLANEATSTLHTANATMGELQVFTNRLNDPNSSLGLLMNDASLYNHVDSTMNNASLLLEDLRLHPMRYVHFSLFGKKAK